MADFWLIREGMNLRPYGAESAAVMAKLPFGKAFFVNARQPRNGAHNRLFWTLCHRIADAIGAEGDDICHILKVRTGHVKQIRTKRGIEEVPLSISFAKMDQIAFNAFFEKCLVVIETEIGIARPDALAAVKDLLDQRDAA